MWQLISPEEGVERLQEAQLIAYPTEGVIGLGCDPHSEKALHALLTLKQRCWRKGFLLVAPNLALLEHYVALETLTEEQKARLIAGAQTHTTFLVPSKKVSPLLIGAHKTLAVRLSLHPIIVTLCNQFQGPITSTSANRSGSAQCADIRAQIPRVRGSLGQAQGPSEIRCLQTDQILRARRKTL